MEARIDRGDLQDLAHHNGRAAKDREQAAAYRDNAEGMQDEAALRTRLAATDPDRHHSEQQGRIARARQQRQAAQKRTRASTEADVRSRGYQPPPPSRSGPSLRCDQSRSIHRRAYR